MENETTIIIVDDIPGNVDVLRKTLEVEGYSISMAPSGEVVLSLTEGGPEKVCVAIRDTGGGIPQDKHEKIFDPLYRLENHVKNCIDGVGVGLTVVKKFMTIMRGRVYVESKLGGGTCFTLEFEKWAGKDSV